MGRNQSLRVGPTAEIMGFNLKKEWPIDMRQTCQHDNQAHLTPHKFTKQCVDPLLG